MARDGVPDTELVQRRADQAGLVRDRVARAVGSGGPAAAEQIDPDHAVGAGQQRDQQVPRAQGRGGPVDEHERGGVAGAVLAHVEPVVQEPARLLGGTRPVVGNGHAWLVPDASGAMGIPQNSA